MCRHEEVIRNNLSVACAGLDAGSIRERLASGLRNAESLASFERFDSSPDSA